MSEDREHITDGKPCWCGPIAQREGEAIIWIHRQLPPCPGCAEKDSRIRHLCEQYDIISRRPSPSTEAGMSEEVKEALAWADKPCMHFTGNGCGCEHVSALAAYIRRLSAGKEGI